MRKGIGYVLLFGGFLLSLAALVWAVRDSFTALNCAATHK